MFSYVGIINGTAQVGADGTEVIYPVLIPSLFQRNETTAAVLTLPGILTEYATNDVVLITDMDSDGLTTRYVILGLIQKNGTEYKARSLGYLSVDYASIATGNISSPVTLRENVNESINYLMNTLESLQAQVVSLQTRISTLSKYFV